MDFKRFIERYRLGFGDIHLPVVFWYSEAPVAAAEKTKGCYIGALRKAIEGGVISFSADTISCPGGKLYAGFINFPPHIGKFVSEKEKYKESEGLVNEFIEDLNLPRASKAYINFASMASIEGNEDIEGVIFFATPDVLSGLVSWALYDTNEPDAVSVPFGSGCSSMVAQATIENRKHGKRTFLGLFDPSARPSVEANILSFTIPMSRFTEMAETIHRSCLQGTGDWQKVKDRINNGE